MAPPTDRARAIVENDMHELVAQACQQMDRRTVADDVAPEVATQLVLTNIIERTYEDLTPDETEAIRQDLAARMNIAAIARRMAQEEMESGEKEPVEDSDADGERSPDALNLIRMVKKFINVRELDIDLIDSINPFREGFDIASKALDTPLLQQIQSAMVAQRVQMTEEEALVLWPRIKRFTAQEGRPPNPNSPDDLERRLAEAHAYIRTKKAERMRAAQGGA
jgi:hypothetical protein